MDWNFKVKLPKAEIHNAYWPHNKEQVTKKNLVVNTKDGLKNPITIRCFMGRSNQASVVYACVWIHGKEISCSGKGSAGGWGYHKESAAVHDAINNAGISLGKSIHGVGDSAVEAAMYAIARKLGYKGNMVIV